MKKCTQCEFTTLDDTLDYCYRCGGKLQVVMIAPVEAQSSVKSTTHYICSTCGEPTEIPNGACQLCGGVFVPVISEKTTLTPPELKTKDNRIKRCTNCNYSTNNLTYARCPKCSYPLIEVEGKTANEQKPYEELELVVTSPLTNK